MESSEDVDLESNVATNLKNGADVMDLFGSNLAIFQNVVVTPDGFIIIETSEGDIILEYSVDADLAGIREEVMEVKKCKK